MKQKIRVLKYGGTSVATNEKIIEIAKYLKCQNEKLIVVVSAMNKTTDELIKQIKNISKTPPKEELDLLLSLGEQKTIALMSTALKTIGVKSKFLNAYSLNLTTIGEHTKAKIKNIDSQKILNYLQDFDVLVIAGFQGLDENTKQITTLGRGGSDLSAVALGACLNTSVEIYTDTTGVFTLDPRINANAKQILQLTYEEMMEMSIKGSGVLESRSVALGKKYNIEIYLAKSLSKYKGTLITNKGDKMENKVISGISLDQDVLQVKISNFNVLIENISNLFTKIASLNINIDMISNDNCNMISFTCNKNEINEIEKLKIELEKKYKDINIKINMNLAKVSLIGIGMNQESGVGSRVFKSLAENKINLNLITTSNISISLLVDKNKSIKCVNALAQEFNLVEDKNV